MSQTENTQAADSEDNDLFEAPCHSTTLRNRIRTKRNADQELVEDDNCGDHWDTDANCPLRYVPRRKCSRTESSNDRQEYLNNLLTSIAEKTDADAKRMKLDPQNSWEGDDPIAVNGDVDLATKDLMHTRIHIREPRASIKRACTFDELTQSCKTSKKEMRSILNICDSGRSG